MPKISSSRTVAFSVARIYAAVLDVESYPRVLSFVRNIKVLERTETGMIARVCVGLPMVNFSYDCRVVGVEGESVTIALISGPFKKLDASWRFEAVGEAECLIHYALDSEFKNLLMEKTAGAFFATQLTQSMLAFEAELRKKSGAATVSHSTTE